MIDIVSCGLPQKYVQVNLPSFLRLQTIKTLKATIYSLK